ncbi:hypothetical protein JZ751_009288 [Albula glossodonta]|uniref:Uncharacterized protein n=1 Tax=Albula glossodonta TaxID=121402 RepID=A0A8T2N8F6_9TELE|nr:hypothetical protein JZ751_009288 [Albula glossodonta]
MHCGSTAQPCQGTAERLRSPARGLQRDCAALPGDCRWQHVIGSAFEMGACDWLYPCGRKEFPGVLTLMSARSSVSWSSDMDADWSVSRRSSSAFFCRPSRMATAKRAPDSVSRASICGCDPAGLSSLTGPKTLPQAATSTHHAHSISGGEMNSLRRGGRKQRRCFSQPHSALRAEGGSCHRWARWKAQGSRTIYIKQSGHAVEDITRSGCYGDLDIMIAAAESR